MAKHFFFKRRENEIAEVTLKISALTSFLIFSALKFAAFINDLLFKIKKGSGKNTPFPWFKNCFPVAHIAYQ